MVEADAVRELRAEVRKLRRSAWAWRAAGLLALAWAVARPVGAVGPQAGPKRMTVEVLTIVDEKGRERIVMAADDDGPEMMMFDAKGAGRIAMGVSQAVGPGLSIMGPKSDGRIQMGVHSDAPHAAHIDTFDPSDRMHPLLDKAGKPIR